MSQPEERPHFPATGLSQTPTGSTPTCDLHAQGIVNLFGFMGACTYRAPLTEPAECENCINYWKAKQRAGT